MTTLTATAAITKGCPQHLETVREVLHLDRHYSDQLPSEVRAVVLGSVPQTVGMLKKVTSSLEIAADEVLSTGEPLGLSFEDLESIAECSRSLQQVLTIVINCCMSDEMSEFVQTKFHYSVV